MAKGVKTRRGESKGTAKTYIYNIGDENVALCGGLTKWAYLGTVNITKNSGNIVISMPSGPNAGGLNSINKFDWTPFSTLFVKYKLTAPSNKKFGVFSTLYHNSEVAKIDLTPTTTELISQVDVSSVNGSYYLSSYFNADDGAVNFTVYEIWLE